MSLYQLIIFVFNFAVKLFLLLQKYYNKNLYKISISFRAHESFSGMDAMDPSQ